LIYDHLFQRKKNKKTSFFWEFLISKIFISRWEKERKIHFFFVPKNQYAIEFLIFKQSYKKRTKRTQKLKTKKKTKGKGQKALKIQRGIPFIEDFNCSNIKF